MPEPVLPHIVLVVPGGYGHVIPMVELSKRLSSRHVISFVMPGPVLDELVGRGIVTPSATSSSADASPAGPTESDGLAFVPRRIRYVRLKDLPPFPEDCTAGFDQIVNTLRALKPALAETLKGAAERLGWGSEAPASARQLGGDDARTGDLWPTRPVAIVGDFFCMDCVVGAAAAVPQLKDVRLFGVQAGSPSVIGKFMQHVASGEPLDVDEELPEVPPENNIEETFAKLDFIDGTNLLMLPKSKPMQLAFAKMGRAIASSNGLLVDALYDIEKEAVEAMNKRNPKAPIYAIGPLSAFSLVEEGRGRTGLSPVNSAIMSWLDRQQNRSVVYVSFGSLSVIGEEQVREIERALFGSGHAFLWSLRANSQQGYLSPETRACRKSAGDGLIEVPARNGKSGGLIADWCPQRAVLQHSAVGAFISHCGWNGSIEAIGGGVPIVAWPFFADQHLNAEFLVQRDMAVQIRHTKLFGRLVPADEITDALREVYEGRVAGGKTRLDVAQELSSVAKRAVSPGGSSARVLAAFPFID